MALTITKLNGSTSEQGAGAKSPAYAGGVRTVVFEIYDVAWDTAYAASGESIADIFSAFQEVLGIFPAAGETTVANQRYFQVDYTNQKLIMYTTAATEASGDQATIVNTRLLVVGFR